jgi:hypothetical protein
MTQQEKNQEAIEEILGSMIDEWYERIQDYYVTVESKAKNPEINEDEELKRFHDKNGHRIKFDKDELDFTYGLRSIVEEEGLQIEVSANNKVENFDINDFKTRLTNYYRKSCEELVPTPAELKTYSFRKVFQLGEDPSEILSVEIREGKADIIRLAFRLNTETLKKLIIHPRSSKELIEQYCVTPFRTIYAAVYRKEG